MEAALHLNGTLGDDVEVRVSLHRAKTCEKRVPLATRQRQAQHSQAVLRLTIFLRMLNPTPRCDGLPSAPARTDRSPAGAGSTAEDGQTVHARVAHA